VRTVFLVDMDASQRFLYTAPRGTSNRHLQHGLGTSNVQTNPSSRSQCPPTVSSAALDCNDEPNELQTSMEHGDDHFEDAEINSSPGRSEVCTSSEICHVPKNWILEIMSLLVSLLSLVAIILVATFKNYKPLTNVIGALTLNAFVAILTSIFKATLYLPVVKSLSELMWLWFSTAPAADLVCPSDSSSDFHVTNSFVWAPLSPE
jgi:hypothetical protein